jgi:hypothetical protein
MASTLRLRGVCLLLAVVVLAVLAPALTPAQAGGPEPRDHVVLVDQLRDVWQFYPGDDPGTLIGSRPTVDIVRARAWHGDTAVGMRLRFVNLRRTPHDQVLQVLVRTPDRGFVAYVSAGPDDRAGTAELMRLPSGAPVSCRGLRHTVSYADDKVVLRVPRSCVGSPDWVRLQLTELLELAGTPTMSPSSLVDNPHNASGVATFTPRLYD